MPVHNTLDSVEATTKAVDALLTAIVRASSQGAAVAYRAALTRHGRDILDTAGPEGMTAVLARIRSEPSDDDAAAVREAIVLQAWKNLLEQPG